MVLEGIRGFSSVDEYVKYKLANYEKEEKNFRTLFRYMFDESNNIMAESTDGYRIKKTTYAQFKNNILRKAPSLALELTGIERGSLIGLYMSNSVEWIELFWATLMCGYNVLIMNTRLPNSVLDQTVLKHNVKAVISDSESFSVKTLFSKDIVLSDSVFDDSGEYGKKIIFMSSGTTEKIKLCAYTGESLYYQVRDSVNIVKTCPGIKSGYNGQIKQIILLPFCHVFGFIAVYMWFGFFARTFVFPKDLNPTTIQNTVKKHQVTHIFAVPMVWESVHKAAIGKIKATSNSTYKRFKFMHAITLKTGKFGNFIAKRAFKELREKLFGDSVQFIITGGSHIKRETLEFFNGIGYHTANGYGMTEIGITSVEKSNSKKVLCSGSIGAPFGNTFYKLSDDGELWVKGKTRAAEITQEDKTTATDYDSWFPTGDIAKCVNGRYYINGRKDDLIITDSGENLNPVIAEQLLSVKSVDKLCIFQSQDGFATLLASVPGCFSEQKIASVYAELSSSIEKAGLQSEIKGVYITSQELIKDGEIKINRLKIARRFANGEFKIIDSKKIKDDLEDIFSELESEVRACFAETLGKDMSEIGVSDNFFTDLGGTSLDYFTLRSLIKQRLGVEIITDDGKTLSNIKEICQHIKM